MKLTKAHRVLKFKQAPWIKQYIELNTSLRQKAACKAEEDLPKLMNNSFFGKTCDVIVCTLESNIKHSLQDVMKYKSVKFIFGEKNESKVQKAQNNPLFERAVPYGPYSCAILLRKRKVVLEKAPYIGTCILAISKVFMYNFHYSLILPNFPGLISINLDICILTLFLPDAKLGFTDTDSFLYSLHSTDNIYSKLRKIDPEEKWMDFSSYSKQHPNYSRKNHLIPGKFKDEGAGMNECVVFSHRCLYFF